VISFSNGVDCNIIIITIVIIISRYLPGRKASRKGEQEKENPRVREKEREREKTQRKPS